MIENSIMQILISHQITFEWKDRISQQICIAERSSHRSKFMIERTTFTLDLNMRGGYTLESLRFEIPEMKIFVSRWIISSGRTGYAKRATS
jgi:hypothetical protein